MATITFKAKAKQVYNSDETLAYQIIMVPVLTTKHCDMGAFRSPQHRFSGIANSALFPNALARIKREMFKGRDYFRTDQVPDGVTIDESGFLTTVSFDA